MIRFSSNKNHLHTTVQNILANISWAFHWAKLRRGSPSHEVDLRKKEEYYYYVMEPPPLHHAQTTTIRLKRNPHFYLASNGILPPYAAYRKQSKIKNLDGKNENRICNENIVYN